MFSLGKDKQLKATQEKVCNICGNRGFSNALMYCSECLDTTVHQYCLDIPPGSDDDDYKWVCEYCPTPLDAESSSLKFGGASVQGTLSSCKDYMGCLNTISTGDIDDVVDLSQPLCILLPVSCSSSSDQVGSGNEFENGEKMWTEQEATVSSFMECPESVMSGIVLLASPSGEIIIHRGVDFNDMHYRIAEGNLSSSAFMAPNVLKAPEFLVSSFMEHPEPIMDGLVLLASESGIITIDGVMSFPNYPHCLGFAVPDLDSFHECNSDEVKSGLPYNCIAGETVDAYGNNAHDSDTGETIVQNEPCLGTNGNFHTCHPPESSGMSKVVGYTDNGTQVNESPKIDGIEVEDEATVASNNLVESSILSKKRKRSETLGVHRPENIEAKDCIRDESNISVRSSAQKRKRRKPVEWLNSPGYIEEKTEDMSKPLIDDLRIKIPLETALTAEAEKESIMTQILDLFRGAGWTVRWRTKSSGGNKARVYCNPGGRIFPSLPKACKALGGEVLDKLGSFYEKGYMENYFSVKVTLETALTVGDMTSIRKQVEDMLLSAGWKFEYRCLKRVYVSPEGQAHRSFTEAYSELQREVVEGKSKLKAGKAYLNSVRDLVVDVLEQEGWTIEHRRCKGSAYRSTVYVDPEGKPHWSITSAYQAIQQNDRRVRQKMKSVNI